MKRHTGESGQVLIMTVLAMSIFLIGAIGLAIDGANLFSQRQMAQTAADAAAQAGIMSVFDKTYVTAGFDPAAGPFYCGIDNARTPCKYAGHNGFGATNSDTIYIEFPPASDAPPGVHLASDEYPLVRATVTRSVPTTLMRFLGPTASSVKAVAIAAVTNVVAPIPILVTHPTLCGALYLKGTGSENKISIIGGPEKSVQVNSTGTIDEKGKPCSPEQSWGGTGGYLVDLTKAGLGGAGGDFGAFGPSAGGASHVDVGAGDYIQPSSPINDPLASVPAPTDAPAPSSAPATVNKNDYGCPAAKCTLYYPGKYSSIVVKNDTALFMPGLYFITGDKGFTFESNGNGQMATGAGVISDIATGSGMVVYMAGIGAFTVVANAGTETGINLKGDTIPMDSPGSVYKGILFFDRNAPGKITHDLQGGGSMLLTGTIYLQTTSPTIANYQTLALGGNAGSTTTIDGMIIVDSLQTHGTPTITMRLPSNLFLNIRQVALVR